MFRDKERANALPARFGDVVFYSRTRVLQPFPVFTSFSNRLSSRAPVSRKLVSLTRQDTRSSRLFTEVATNKNGNLDCGFLYISGDNWNLRNYIHARGCILGYDVCIEIGKFQ